MDNGNFTDLFRSSCEDRITRAKFGIAEHRGDTQPVMLGLTEACLDDALHALFAHKGIPRKYFVKTELASIEFSCIVREDVTVESVWPAWELIKERIKVSKVDVAIYVLLDDALRSGISHLNKVSISYQKSKRGFGTFGLLSGFTSSTNEGAVNFDSNVKAVLTNN